MKIERFIRYTPRAVGLILSVYSGSHKREHISRWSRVCSGSMLAELSKIDSIITLWMFFLAYAPKYDPVMSERRG